MPCKTTWNFSCGHTLIQTNPDNPGHISMKMKTSTEKCPECKETEESNLEKEKMARKKDQQALDTWQAQVTTIERHIKYAGDNVELKADLKKILNNCHDLWARKVIAMEKRLKDDLLAEDEHGEFCFCRVERVFRDGFRTLRLLLKAKTEMLAQARSDGEKEKLRKEVDESTRLDKELLRLNEYYNLKVAHGLKHTKTGLHQILTDALKLGLSQNDVTHKSESGGIEEGFTL